MKNKTEIMFFRYLEKITNSFKNQSIILCLFMDMDCFFLPECHYLYYGVQQSGEANF